MYKSYASDTAFGALKQAEASDSYFLQSKTCLDLGLATIPFQAGGWTADLERSLPTRAARTSVSTSSGPRYVAEPNLNAPTQNFNTRN